MSSYTPRTDLWLERSRLAGMLLAAVSYGIFFLLTLQATTTLTRRLQRSRRTTRHHGMLLSYVWITFVLATIGFAGNARYTEMIWIDLRNAPGGPAALILDEMNYWINMLALTCYYIMEWFMQALLLYRCFVLWNWQKRIIVPMSTIFASMVAMSILVLAEASGAVFYDINTQLAYLCLQIGLTLLYTLLVVWRLLALRTTAPRATPETEKATEDPDVSPSSSAYATAVTMIVESAALYAPVGIIFMVSFALHSDVTNLVFLSVSHVQGIAQLLIIVRIAKGGQGALPF